LEKVAPFLVAWWLWGLNVPQYLLAGLFVLAVSSAIGWEAFAKTLRPWLRSWQAMVSHGHGRKS